MSSVVIDKGGEVIESSVRGGALKGIILWSVMSSRACNGLYSGIIQINSRCIGHVAARANLRPCDSSKSHSNEILKSRLDRREVITGHTCTFTEAAITLGGIGRPLCFRGISRDGGQRSSAISMQIDGHSWFHRCRWIENMFKSVLINEAHGALHNSCTKEL